MNKNMAWEGWKAWRWGKGNHVKSAKANYKAISYAGPVTSIRILKLQIAQKIHVLFQLFILLVVVCCLFLSTLWTPPLLHGMLKIAVLQKRYHCDCNCTTYSNAPFPHHRWFLTVLKAIIPEFLVLQIEGSSRGALCSQSPSHSFHALAVCIPWLQHRVQCAANPDLSPTTCSG